MLSSLTEHAGLHSDAPGRTIGVSCSVHRPEQKPAFEGSGESPVRMDDITHPRGVVPGTKEVFTQLVERVRREKRGSAPRAGDLFGSPHSKRGGTDPVSDAMIEAMYTRACGRPKCDNCLSHHKWVYGSRSGRSAEAELLYAVPTGLDARTVASWLSSTGHHVRVLDAPRDAESVIQMLALAPPAKNQYGGFFDLTPVDRRAIVEKAVRARMSEEEPPPHEFNLL